MPEALAPYHTAVVALGMLGFLYLVQLLVADVAGITRRHTPGMPVDAGHDDFLFRAVRAHANTSESIGAVILIAGFAIACAATPSAVNLGLSAFVVFRLIHMLAYYLDVRILRSVAFGLGVLSLITVFGAAVRAL